MNCPECKKDLDFDVNYQVSESRGILILGKIYSCTTCDIQITKLESYQKIKDSCGCVIENGEIKELCKLHGDREKQILKEKQNKCSIKNKFEKILKKESD